MANKPILIRWFSAFIHRHVDEETQNFEEIATLLDEPRNGYLWLRKHDIRSVESLCLLTHHHNGYLREKAVIALSMKRDVAALRDLLICVNDWVKPIHHAAMQEVLALMTTENAAVFIRHLAQIRQLRECKRYDHTPFVAQICRFLTSGEHLPELRQALYSPERALRHAVLQTLIEQHQLHDEATLGFVLTSGDTHLRGIAVTYWLSRSPALSGPLIARLLHDPWPRIRRDTLFYLDQCGQTVPESLHTTLLLDKNGLIQQRARRMLASVVDATAFWHDVVLSPAWSATQRHAALYGLKEVRYPGLHALALWGYTQPENSIRKASLHILLVLEDEAAKDRVLETLADPALSLAMSAMKSLAHHPLPFSRDELQTLLTRSPSDKHTLLYWRLMRQLNKWDWLILLLHHLPLLPPSAQREELTVWKEKYNQAGINPTTDQQTILTNLLAQSPKIRQTLQNYLVYTLNNSSCRKAATQ